MASDTQHFTYDEDSMGNVTITNPEGTHDVFLQGDSADSLLAEIAELDKIWFRRYGPTRSFRRKPFGPFADYESHLDVILDAYEDIMEPIAA